jgi:hypothetical protein
MEKYETCSLCKNEIDPDTCWCGMGPEDHNAYYDGHFFIPIGCDCYRIKEDIGSILDNISFN